MKPLRVFSCSPRDKNFRGFPYKWNHEWFKLEETFLGFLIQSTREDLHGFSLRVNHLWFKLKKTFLCTTVHHWGIQTSFDKHYKNLTGCYTTWRNCINNSYNSAIKVLGFWSKDTALEWHNREAVSLFLNNFLTTFNGSIK